MNIKKNIPACEQEKVPKDFNWVIKTVSKQSGYCIIDTPKHIIEFQGIRGNGCLVNHFHISFLTDKTLSDNRSLIGIWTKRIYTSSEIQFLEDY